MRKMIWIKNARTEAWGCSQCAWTYRPTGPPIGSGMDEMKQNFESQRDKEFATHVCAEHRVPKSVRDDVKSSR
jgi:hypothetical protein